MITRRSLIAGGIAAMFAPAAAGTRTPVPLVATIQGRLVDAPVLRGRFEQRRKLKDFRHALVSGGRFLIARSHGVYWHTVDPFESTLIVTRDRVLSRHPDGSAAPSIDAKREPGLRIINELLFALMAADLQMLATHFHVDASLDGEGSWQLVLHPRDLILAQWLTQVALKGDEYVRTIILEEGAGDRSVIHLTGHSASRNLTTEEAAHFG